MKQNLLSDSSEYSRIYSDFAGVDFASDPAQVDVKRLPYAVNVWKDYRSENAGFLETVPGFRKLSLSFEGASGGINGIFRLQSENVEGRDYIVYHRGEKLYWFIDGERDDPTVRQIEEVAYVRNARSSAYNFKGSLVILTGDDITEVSEVFSDTEGEYLLIGKSLIGNAYEPTTYQNFLQYEQRNMLTDYAWEEITTGSEEQVSQISASQGKWKQIPSLSEIKTYNANQKVTEQISGAVFEYIPSKKTGYDGNIVLYKWSSDTESNIQSLFLDAVKPKDDAYTVYDLSDIKKYFPRIGNIFVNEWDFEKCSLYGIPNGINFKCYPDYVDGVNTMIEKGENPLCRQGYVTDVLTIDNEWESLDDYQSLKNSFKQKIPFLQKGYLFTIMEKAIDVDRVEIDGVIQSPENYNVCYSEYATKILLKEANTDTVVRIRLILSESEFDTAKGHLNFREGNRDYKGTTSAAIAGCTVSCGYDGRIFLTGNPHLPNTVFYAQRDLTGYVNPTYFGVLNYFNNGSGQSKNTAMVSSYSSLMVLKEASDTDGTVSAWTGADTGEDLIPRIYTRTEGLPGVGCVGAAVNFLDDICFLSDRGLEAIGRQTVNLERSIAHRSSNVDPKLTDCDLASASVAEWMGYLCILSGGKMFLADSRRTFTHKTGDEQYEWWYLDGIGTYEGYRDRYRMMTSLPSSEEFPEDVKAFGTEEYVDSSPGNIFTATYGGTVCYYVKGMEAEGNPVKYLVDCVDGEKEGTGEFFPASVCLASGDVLYFGTGCGDICCFNTDKRGIDRNGNRLPEDLADKYAPEWYTFAGTAYPSGFATCRDCAGYPHVTKTTVNSSLVIKVKRLPMQEFKVQVSTDRKTMHPISPKGNHTTSLVSTDFDAGRVDFGNVGFGDSNVIPFKEKEKKWVEKQYYIYSDGFERPFGVAYLSYRYRVAGKVK